LKRESTPKRIFHYGKNQIRGKEEGDVVAPAKKSAFRRGPCAPLKKKIPGGKRKGSPSGVRPEERQAFYYGLYLLSEVAGAAQRGGGPTEADA